MTAGGSPRTLCRSLENESVRRKSVSGSTDWCHVCGLQIPSDVVNWRHPLFGTIDHLTPLSRGGKDKSENRKPCHRVCNQLKGSRLDLTGHFRVTMQGLVRGLLKMHGVHVGRNAMARARQRAGINLDNLENKPGYIQRWEEEGGSVGERL
jgi:hypothetical protein